MTVHNCCFRVSKPSVTLDAVRKQPLASTFMRLLPLVTALLLAVSGPLSAAPADDPMQDLLVNKGLMERVGEKVSQVGHQAGQAASELVVTAMGFLGVPYRRGGNSFETGLDCSGFVRAIYQQTVGLLLPRQAAEQAQATREIPKEELRPGDLVFFNTLRRAYSHVGIYIGEGKFIHSPRPGGQVRVEDMQVSYWKTRFNGARRVEGVEQPPVINP